MYDILIKNARIADGTGNPMYHADVAVEDGCDVFCDQYPYIASSNGLKINIPVELHALGLPKMIEMVTDPVRREQMKPAVLKGMTAHERMKCIMLGDYAQPARGNIGFACVMVNGKIALENDQVTGTLAGKLLFREQM